MLTLERVILGGKYMKIARELQKYDLLPQFLWTKETKKVVSELLEQMAELDVKLAGYLIADGDEAGMNILNQNQKLYTEKLWNLKRDLALG